MHESPGHFQSREIDFPLGLYPPSNHHLASPLSLVNPPLSLLYDQSTSGHNPFLVQDGWHLPETEYSLLPGGEFYPTAVFSNRPQIAHLSYEEKAVQTDQSDDAIGNHLQEERPAHLRPTPHDLVSQATYKPMGRVGLVNPRDVCFVVGGEMGFRLSDAYKGNWTDLEDRDNSSLFEGENRTQIMLRLLLRGCPPWQSKISIKDFSNVRRPITRMKLAKEVAKSVSKFIAREKLQGNHGGRQCRWGNVSLENMFLTRIVRVSTASWQPELYIEHPPIASGETAPTSSSSDQFA